MSEWHDSRGRGGTGGTLLALKHRFYRSLYLAEQSDLRLFQITKIIDDIASDGFRQRYPADRRLPRNADQAPALAVLVGVAAMAVDEDDLLSIDHRLRYCMERMGTKTASPALRLRSS
jgi:hypothetical protein